MTVLRIFLAEDDPIILMGFKKMVEKLGHEVVGEAMDGLEAVQEIRRIRPELIIMDINMPKLDGICVMEQLKAEEIDIPSIIVTGYRDQELVDRATRAGVLGYMQKPIDEYELRTAIGLAMRHDEDIKKLQKDVNRSKHALEERKLVERAKGILMDQFGLKEVEAMRALQKKSRDMNKKLSEVAREIIHAAQVLK